MNGKDPAVVLTDDATAVRKAVESDSEALVADAERGPQLVAGERLVGRGRRGCGLRGRAKRRGLRRFGTDPLA